MDDFPIIDVTEWEIVTEEPGGELPKEWLRHPETGERWLHKWITSKLLDDGTPYERGQDWAEKVAAEIANFLGLPAARVELAIRGGARGTISRHLAPGSLSLSEGGNYLADVAGDEYEPWTESNKVRNRVGHNLANIELVLGEALAPIDSEPDVAEMDAMSVFGGYLLFDALIANRDRHDKNWAVVRTAEGAAHLSATFDHGAALGSGLDPAYRASRLPAIARWCSRGTAHRFEHGTDKSLVDFAFECFARRPAARSFWVDRVLAITPERVAEMLSRVPVMSDVERTFVLAVVTENQRRIRDVANG